MPPRGKSLRTGGKTGTTDARISEGRPLFHGWRARTHYLTRDRRFLLRTSAVIIIVGLITASLIVIGRQPQDARGEMHLSSDGPRIDESPNHRIGTGGLIMEASAATYVVTPHFHVLSGNIVLDAGGSKIAISSGGQTTTPTTLTASPASEARITGTRQRFHHLAW